ncbi:MAG TPA: ankyrin repeat domain-containing protein [Gammaproteobacteria bacterium]|nr:ankyrin repeat domain-containing protein [Gammaproteobacteria bacterium]
MVIDIVHVNHLHALLWSPETLTAALDENPKLITQKTATNGYTLLHCAVHTAITHQEHAKLNKMIDILLNSPHLDLHLQDHRGNTAVHEAAAHCNHPIVAKFIFPAMVRAAAKRHFDFTTKNKEGKTILHLACLAKPSEDKHIINNVSALLETNCDFARDTLSASGSSALAYAINKQRYLEANALLDAGANPSIFAGHKRRKPLKDIKYQLKKLENYLLNPEFAHLYESFLSHQKQLKQLQEKIGLILSQAEITKNTIVITQSVRGLSLFSWLPKHLQFEIIALTKTHPLCSKERAEVAASKIHDRYLSKENLVRPNSL